MCILYSQCHIYLIHRAGDLYEEISILPEVCANREQNTMEYHSL